MIVRAAYGRNTTGISVCWLIGDNTGSGDGAIELCDEGGGTGRTIGIDVLEGLSPVPGGPDNTRIISCCLSF